MAGILSTTVKSGMCHSREANLKEQDSRATKMVASERHCQFWSVFSLNLYEKINLNLVLVVILGFHSQLNPIFLNTNTVSSVQTTELTMTVNWFTYTVCIYTRSLHSLTTHTALPTSTGLWLLQH